MNALHRPLAARNCVVLRHTPPFVAGRLVADLEAAVEHARSNPEAPGGMATVYGLANALPLRGIVGDILKRYNDLLHKV